MVVLLILFIVLIIINMPIAFVIGISGLGYFFTNPEIPLSIAVQRVVSQTQSFAFLAVPFFIFAGNLMNETGITKRLLSLAGILTRRMVGGLAQVNVVLSTLMGGISGSATADAAMEIRVLGPDMLKKGYSKGYTAAVTCLTSMITCTIPPSLGLILYGFIGEVSIGKLFTAGIVPGILMMGVLMATVHITSKKKGYDIPGVDVKAPSLKEILLDLKSSIWAFIFPVILILGIRFGFFTPSEAGAFAVVYALIIGKFIYKELTLSSFLMAVKNSVMDTGAIILIVSLSGIFGYALTYSKLPIALSEFLLGITSNPQMLMVIILSFLMISGMFVDSNVNILLLTPIFLPMVMELGVDPVHFGICMMTIVTLGIMTPPVGTALYVVCGIIDCPLQDFVKDAMPFYFAIFLLVIFLVFFPGIVMWLPNLVY